MKILLVGDVHIADKPPSIRTDDYVHHILAKLEQLRGIYEAHECSASIFVGDIFHVKAASRNSHWLVQRLIDILRLLNPWVVPGNHDIVYDRLDTLDRQPLGVLFRSGAANPLIGVDYLMEMGGRPVFGIPWRSDWTTILDDIEEWKAGPGGLIVAHAPILPPGMTAPYDYIDAQELGQFLGKDADVFYGHIHDNHGVYTTRHGTEDVFETHAVQFCNFGAISRGSLHEQTLKRKPAVAVYDSLAHTFERVELVHLPVEEVFKLDIKQEEDLKDERVAEFLQSVDSTILEGLSIEAVLKDIEEMDIKPRTKEIIKECLEVALNA